MNSNIDSKVWVTNLCNWNLYFKRAEGIGDIKIQSKGKLRLPIAEIQSQVYSNNIMFVGTDGKGSNARIYIEDKDTRILVGFESEDSTEIQVILNEEKIKDIIEIKAKKSFEDNVKKYVKTDAEKKTFVESVIKLGLNDFDKIKFIESYTDLKVVADNKDNTEN
jgi:LEA14-like dessication related protein